jgi:hypothetical protein
MALSISKNKDKHVEDVYFRSVEFNPGCLMNRHVSLMSFAAAVSAVTLSFPATASAANLSAQAANLLSLAPDSNNYQTQFTNVQNDYANQASDYSLDFEDWFAINSFVNNERAAYGTNGAKLEDLVALDLADLTWEAGAEDVEVFFINEGAGYRNQFGFSTNVPTGSGNSGLVSFWDTEVTTIWNDVSSQNSILSNWDGPLALGQGYQIGDVAAGDRVNFFLRNPHSKVFDSESADQTQNGDGLQHVTTYQYEDFLILAYEDIYGGGDRDYNDVVIAVRGLTDTSKDVPEPAGILGLISLGVMGVVRAY